MAIDPLLLTVAPVECVGSGDLGQGTGFFYALGEDEEEVYFITNRHVVVDETDGYRPETLRLRLHTDLQDVSANRTLSVPLYDQRGQPRWLEHPSGDGNIDVVGLPMDARRIKNDYAIAVITPNNHVPDDVELSVGQSLHVIGYPLGFYDQVHNLPILRNASMASAYPIPFQGNPHVLVDAEFHEGISGGLVMTEPSIIQTRADGSTAFMSNPATHFVGVFSAEIAIEEDEEEEEELGLGVVWFSELVPQIIQG